MPPSTPKPTLSTYDLLDAFGQEGCPVCSLALHGVAHYMGSINYDSVGDQGFRSQFKDALGFCNTHAYQWLHTAFILGTAQLYDDALRIIADSLRASSYEPDGLTDRLASLLSPHAEGSPVGSIARPTASCPACAHVAKTESMLIGTLVKQLADPSFRDAYKASSGLCIPHLRMAFAASPTPEAFELLRRHALETEEFMISQLKEIIRKHDYRFRHEPIGEERGAAERAVRHVIGADKITKLQII